MTERALLDALQAARYPGSSWAFIRHVNEGTGARAGRILDALAMSLWPSRGLHLHGIEAKCHRSDWLRELDQPAKADGWVMACHAFYLATPPGVAKIEELPTGWGLIEVGDKVKVLRESEQRHPQPPNWQRLAAILRAATKAGEDVVPRREVKDLARQLAQPMVEAELAMERSRGRRDREHDSELIVSLRRFCDVSGIDIPSCSDELAKLAGETVRGQRHIDRIQNELAALKNRLRDLLA